MDQLRSIPTPVVLTCFSGPDQGKRLALSGNTSTLGRSPQCDLLSDDRDVAERHVVFELQGGQPLCKAIDNAPLFVDGQRTQEVGTPTHFFL